MSTPIIVEGPDGSGKTTLIESIQAETHRDISPRVVSKDTLAMIDLQEWVHQDNRRPAADDNLIYDRHRLISEPIYGPVMRRTSSGFDDARWLFPHMKQFYRRNPLIVYCLPPKGIVLENVDADLDNVVVKTKISTIYDLYIVRAALDFVHQGAIVYDYTQPHILEMVVNLCLTPRLRPDSH